MLYKPLEAFRERLVTGGSHTTILECNTFQMVMSLIAGDLYLIRVITTDDSNSVGYMSMRSPNTKSIQQGECPITHLVIRLIQCAIKVPISTL